MSGRGFLFRFRETVQNRKVGVRPNPPNGGHLLGRRQYPVPKSARRRATNSASCSRRPPMICSSVNLLFFIVRLLVTDGEIGRAACRASVCQYVLIWVGGVS